MRRLIAAHDWCARHPLLTLPLMWWLGYAWGALPSRHYVAWPWWATATLGLYCVLTALVGVVFLVRVGRASREVVRIVDAEIAGNRGFLDGAKHGRRAARSEVN